MLWDFFFYPCKEIRTVSFLLRTAKTGAWNRWFQSLSSPNRHQPCSLRWPPLSLPSFKCQIPVYLPSSTGPHLALLCHPLMLFLPRHFTFHQFIHDQSFRKYVRIECPRLCAPYREYPANWTSKAPGLTQHPVQRGKQMEHKETRASLKQVHTVVSVKGREAASEMEPNREGWMLRERL